MHCGSWLLKTKSLPCWHPLAAGRAKAPILHNPPVTAPFPVVRACDVQPQLSTVVGVTGMRPLELLVQQELKPQGGGGWTRQIARNCRREHSHAADQRRRHMYHLCFCQFRDLYSRPHTAFSQGWRCIAPLRPSATAAGIPLLFSSQQFRNYATSSLSLGQPVSQRRSCRVTAHASTGMSEYLRVALLAAKEAGRC